MIGRRPRTRCARLGARHADARRDQPGKAGAPEHALAAQPRRARGASGVGGEIDLMVSGKNVASPRTIEWMSSYQNAVLKRFGYTPTRGCGRARLCPAFSLPTLFEGGALGGGATTSPAHPHPNRPESSASRSPAAAQAHRRRGERPAADDPGVLLPERDHRQPARRHARVRHPPDAARRAAARDRSDARRACTPRAG